MCLKCVRLYLEFNNLFFPLASEISRLEMPRGGAAAASLTADGSLSWGGSPTPLLPLTHSLQGRTHPMGEAGGSGRNTIYKWSPGNDSLHNHSRRPHRLETILAPHRDPEGCGE